MKPKCKWCKGESSIFADECAAHWELRVRIENDPRTAQKMLQDMIVEARAKGHFSKLHPESSWDDMSKTTQNYYKSLFNKEIAA